MIFVIFSFCSFVITLATVLAHFGVLPPLEFGTYNRILTIILFACPSFLIGYGVQSLTGQYGGEVWGKKIRAPKRVTVFRTFGIIGGVFGIAVYIFYFKGILGGLVQDVLNLVIGLVKILFMGRIAEYFSNALYFFLKVSAILLPIWLGASMTTRLGLKMYPFTKDLKSLGEFPIFKRLDSVIDETEYIYINGEEIVTKSFDGEISHFVYANYGHSNLLREVTAAETKYVAAFEVGLLGLYINRKYGKKFKFAINKELVKGMAGSPGVSYTVVTPAGTFKGTVGDTPGIPDKLAFDGYLFTRKKGKK